MKTNIRKLVIAGALALAAVAGVAGGGWVSGGNPTHQASIINEHPMVANGDIGDGTSPTKKG